MRAQRRAQKYARNSRPVNARTVCAKARWSSTSVHEVCSIGERRSGMRSSVVARIGSVSGDSVVSGMLWALNGGVRPEKRYVKQVRGEEGPETAECGKYLQRTSGVGRLYSSGRYVAVEGVLHATARRVNGAVVGGMAVMFIRTTQKRAKQTRRRGRVKVEGERPQAVARNNHMQWGGGMLKRPAPASNR